MAAAKVRGDLAVVTVTYRSAGDLEGFLDSVAASADLPRLTVVADNPSEDTPGTVEIARSRGASVVALDANIGYGGAVNAAVATLPPEVEFVLVSNPDVRLRPDSIGSLIAALRREAAAAAVGPKVLNEDGTVYPSARSIPSLRTGIGHVLFSRTWPGNPWTRSYRQERESMELARPVGWLSGSCLLVRRSSFEAIGGFDEGYFMYFEDVDLGYRFGKSGWQNLYEPASVVTHIGGRSTATVRSPMLRTHHRSADRFLSQKYRGWYLAPLRWTLHVALELRARWLTR